MNAYALRRQRKQKARIGRAVAKRRAAELETLRDRTAGALASMKNEHGLEGVLKRSGRKAGTRAWRELRAQLEAL